MIRIDVPNFAPPTLLFDSARPRRAYGDPDRQRVSEDGILEWVVSLVYRAAGDTRGTTLEVSIPNPTNPSESIQPYSPVLLKDFAVLSGDRDDGKGCWISYRASAIYTEEQVRAARAKRSEE